MSLICSISINNLNSGMGRGERIGSGPRERPFLRSSDEDALFRQRYHRYPRRVISETRIAQDRSFSRLLTEVLEKATRRLQRLERGAWIGFVVRVEDGDGMTWSAAAADRLIADTSFLPRRALRAEPRSDREPQIVELIPKLRLVALAHRTGVVGSLPTLRRRSVAALVVVVLAVAAVIAILRALGEASGGAGILIPVLGAATAGMLLVGERASARLSRSAREADEERFREALATARTERPGDWQALAEALAEELAGNKKDRAVIVDDFGRLDAITHDALRHYLTHRDHRAAAHELWVVFERVGMETVSKDLNASQRLAGRSHLARLEVLRQESLGEAARRGLAVEVRKPERAEFRLVKLIVGYDLSALDAYRNFFDGQFTGQRYDARAFGALEIAYLLAVERRTGAWAFRQNELIGELSSERSSALRAVLEQLLPGAAVSRGEARAAVEGIAVNMELVLNPEYAEAGEIELAAEAAEVLIERRDRYGLAAADVVHLYWALYWYKKLRGAANVNAYCLRKLARHLMRAVTPEALEAGIGEEAQERFQSALIWTAEQLFAASLPDEVRALLGRAEREMRPGDDVSRLREVCWQAYAVLGDEDMLAIILRLHPASAGQAVSIEDAESLFVESLRFTDPAPEARRELAERLLSLDRDVRAYAYMRGVWLALTIEPTVGSWSLFPRVAKGAAPRVVSLIREALRLLEQPEDPRIAIAALTASLGTWCYALYFIRGEGELDEANEIFEDVRLCAAQLHDDLDQRRREGKSEDYVLRAFAHELETVVAAAAALLARTSVAFEAAAADRSRLEDHVAQALGGGKLSLEGQVTGVKRQLTLQALTWRTLGWSGERSFGFDQLVGFVALREAHLAALLDGSARAVTDFLSDVAEQLDEPGVIGLLAHAIAITRSTNAEISALLSAQSVELAVDCGDRLETEVGIAALERCNSFNFVSDMREAVSRLLRSGEPSGNRSALAARLVEFEESERPLAALWLINAAREGILPELLLAETASMCDYTEDEAARDEIQQLIELFELEDHAERGSPVAVAEVLARWQKRSDSMNYPWMLYLLARRPRVEAELINVAIAYLEEHPESPHTRGPMLLAMQLVRIAERDDAAIPVEGGNVGLAYLDGVYSSAQHILTIELNIEVLALLRRHGTGDPDRNRAGLERWEAARQERDGIRKLPPLVKAGRFFLVLWHYYETLAFYGLGIEPPESRSRLLSRDVEQTLAEWTAGGEEVPDPLVRVPGGVGLSADFLRYGWALFEDAAGGADLEDARGIFNEVALEALPELLDQLKSLPSLPQGVRSLLTEHQAQLFRDLPGARTALVG